MQQSLENSSIQPTKLANKNGQIKFNWPIASFERLKELLYSENGQVAIEINAEYDHRRQCLLVTNLVADVTLQCQTSFDPIDYKIERTVTFCAVVAESQFVDVDEEYEPVLMEDGNLDIKQVVEDELILSIPLVANKPIEEIETKMSFGELDEAEIEKAEKAANPFSVLQNLKKT
ncbi:YceD family protein [Aliikangiella sp. IMCC44653]